MALVRVSAPCAAAPQAIDLEALASAIILYGIIPFGNMQFSMREATELFETGNPARAPRPFTEWRSAFDAIVLSLYSSAPLRRLVRRQSKTNLEVIWEETARKLENDNRRSRAALAPLQVHRKIVEGLPGEALFLSSAMAFDSMAEALELFDVSAKTAKLRIGERLSVGESEIALRIGRVLTMAYQVFGSADAARKYLATPNFALGGAVPRDLLKTAEGEQLVLSELQTQVEGGPV
jgi:putative toxin-antitoxin system antitoxin component (TIGR02293 family)